MKQHVIRGARYIASLAVAFAHMLLALWAASAAGGYAWRHGYTLPYDTSSSAVMSAAIVVALTAGGAVLTLPESWMTQVRFLVRGRPLTPCPSCGVLTLPPTANNDVNTTPKEIAQ
ncbi:hypothetical protein [Streptomyces acidiscabies]|uniref:Integral membrane protein n=1 Tax=Streptomyces acidiscabies TaxID=42234 RepID=A0ABU4MB43_9ACTN|nr:hypothetical protein [Streptomyces acidiscabies]MDX3025346.1 hypothetical protein [Streptomyces acidiscabies]